MELSDYEDSDSQISDLPDHNIKPSITQLLQQRKSQLLAKMEYMEKCQNDSYSGTPENKHNSSEKKLKQTQKNGASCIMIEEENIEKSKELVIENPQRIIIQPPLIDSDLPPQFPNKKPIEESFALPIQQSEQEPSRQKDSFLQNISPSSSCSSSYSSPEQSVENYPSSIMHAPLHKQIISQPLQILPPDKYTQNQTEQSDDPPEMGVQLLETNGADKIRSFLMDCLPEFAMEFLFEVSDQDVMEAFQRTIRVMKGFELQEMENKGVRRECLNKPGETLRREASKMGSFIGAAQGISQILSDIQEKMRNNNE